MWVLREMTNMNEVFVDKGGVIYLGDHWGGGVEILEYMG